MDPQRQTSPKAALAFAFGLLSLGSGLMALLARSDLFRLGVPVGLVLALTFGILGLREVRGSSGRFTGRALAGWGIGLPVGGMSLGFLLLPAT
jgi:hypothetical protein